MLNVAFHLENVTRAESEDLSNALSALNGATGKRYLLTRKWRKFLVARREKVLLAFVSTEQRPSDATIIGVDVAGRILLPLLAADDLRRIAECLGLAKNEEDELNKVYVNPEPDCR